MAQPIVLTGARTIINVNNSLFPLVTDLTIELNMEHVEIQAIDTLSSEEIAPNRVSVRVTMTAIRTPENSYVQRGIMPSVGQIMTANYITLEVKDRVLDSTIFYAPKLRATGMTLRDPARGLASATITFMGIFGWDEAGAFGQADS